MFLKDDNLTSESAQDRLNTDPTTSHVGAFQVQRESQDKPWAPIAFYS